MSAIACSPIGFTLRVPQHWYEFDIWRATRTGELARLIDARIEQAPALAGRRGPLLRFLRGLATDAERQGAVYCAALAEPVADAGYLAASCMVFQTPGPLDPAERTVAAIAAGLTARAAQPAQPAEAAAAGSDTWREVELIDLPAGAAVRVREIARVDQHEHVVMHTLLPDPAWSSGAVGASVVDLVLTSPQVHLALPMLDVFDAISGTFAWLPSPEEESR